MTLSTNRAFYYLLSAYKGLSGNSTHKPAITRWHNQFKQACLALGLDAYETKEQLDNLRKHLRQQ